MNAARVGSGSWGATLRIRRRGSEARRSFAGQDRSLVRSRSAGRMGTGWSRPSRWISRRLASLRETCMRSAMPASPASWRKVAADAGMVFGPASKR